MEEKETKEMEEKETTGGLKTTHHLFLYDTNMD